MSFSFARSDNIWWYSVTTEELEPEQLKELIETTVAAKKEDLPSGKLATFGTLPSPPDANGKGGGSLRWDGNVLTVTGIDVEHDGGQMPFQEALDRLNAAGIIAILHTTPSHTTAHPRWRIWLPFSKPLPPHMRARMVNRVNGLLGGILARESWTLSQCFYFGRVDGVSFEIAVGDGDEYVDEADELDPGLRFQPGPGQTGKTSNGGKQGTPNYADLTEQELKDEITSGRHFHGPAMELLRRWFYVGVAETDAEVNLRAIFDVVPQQQRTRKWTNGWARIPHWIKSAAAYVAKRKGTYWRALVAYLQNDPQWRGAIRFNQFTQQIEVADPFPPQLGQVMAAFRPIRDPIDILEAMMCVQENGFPKVGKDTVTSVIVLVAEHNACHPVRDWLQGLEWDGADRINQLFLHYFKGELPDENDPKRHDEITRYYEKVGECVLVGAVARVMRPGCKVDCLPCLVSPQGFDKSKGLLALCPDPAWFSDDLSTNITDRDAKESLSGKWIIELSEFPHMRRDIERVKAWFSRQVDRYRRAYGRLNMDHPRQCVFCASTNDLEFVDLTGNRRVWPIPLAAEVDVAAIERDREQLWAEAVHWYRKGFPWWLPPEVENTAAEVQDAYVEFDGFDEKILEFLDNKYPANTEGKRRPFTLPKVAEGIGFSYRPSDMNFISKADEMRIARRLRRLGFHPDPHRSRSTGRARFWVSMRKRPR